MHRLPYYYIALIILAPTILWAQLKVYPLEQSSAQPKTVSARVQTTQLSLPFWDDFSRVTGNHPEGTLWQRKDSVLVSSGQGINPPTLNVATFDGLTGNGTAYSPSPSDILDFGYRDTLQSQPIKLNEVTPDLRNTVFLSFFYQWGGNGEPPDTNDFLRLEFKNDSGTWDEITVFRMQPDFDPTVFYTYIHRINEAKYFHAGFQFRFVSFGRKSGQYDAWHIDYVYLNKNRNDSDLSFPDRAVNIKPSAHFGIYQSIPVRHFLQSETITPTSFGLSNLQGISQPMNYQLNARIKSFADHILLNDNTIELEDSASITPSITPFERRIIQTDTIPAITNFNILADSIYLEYTITLRGGDTINVDFGDIDFRVNDTTYCNYSLSKYYAYDDGEAEYSAGLTQPGNQLAYRFEMKTTEQDTINGIDIYYPNFAGTSPSTMDFFIFRDEGGVPGEILYEQLIPVSRTTNNTFTTTNLFEGVIVKESFFIGYTEPVTGRVRIGLDNSNITDTQLFFKSTPNALTWALSDRIGGSLMIRPRFGKGEVNTTAIEEELPHISLFPNPNAGDFYFDSEVEVLRIHSITGQTIDFSTERLNEQTHVLLNTAHSGLYIVQYRKGVHLLSEKIMVNK